MSFRLNQNLKLFNWNKFGGRDEVTLAIFIFLMLNVRKLCLLGVPFNHDKTKFRTKLTCMLRMNLETSRIPPSIMLPVLSFSV